MSHLNVILLVDFNLTSQAWLLQHWRCVHRKTLIFGSFNLVWSTVKFAKSPNFPVYYTNSPLPQIHSGISSSVCHLTKAQCPGVRRGETRTWRWLQYSRSTRDPAMQSNCHPVTRQVRGVGLRVHPSSLGNTFCFSVHACTCMFTKARSTCTTLDQSFVLVNSNDYMYMLWDFFWD